MLYVGAGLWDETSNSHTPVVIALDPSTGKVAWTMAMPVPSGHSRGFGAVRSVIADTRFCHETKFFTLHYSHVTNRRHGSKRFNMA